MELGGTSVNDKLLVFTTFGLRHEGQEDRIDRPEELGGISGWDPNETGVTASSLEPVNPLYCTHRKSIPPAPHLVEFL